MKSARGFSKLELMVASALVSIFAALLLNRLAFYQEAAEKANVEYTISVLKSALRMQMATMLMQERMQDYALLEQQNPMEWLEQKPGNYRGVSDGAASEKRAGYWFFDPHEHALIYWPVRAEHLQVDASGQKCIRLQVRVIYDNTSAALDTSGRQPIATVSLQIVSPYRWLQ